MPHEPLLLIVLTAFGRALFRYRSEVAPVYVGLALTAAGSLLHNTYPTSWPFIALITAGATTAVGLRGVPWGIDRGTERAYAATTTAVAGGWLTMATALSPGRSPMPTILVLAIVVLGVPWWAHRRRRARVRVDRVIHAWPELADTIGLNGSRVMSAVVDTWGWRARMKLRPGQSVADVVARVPAIESALAPGPGLCVSSKTRHTPAVARCAS